MTKQILFTPSAEKDLILAKNFYAKVEPALGEYCVDSLMLDIERLSNENEILIVAVLDNRINPEVMAQRLG